MIVYCVQVEGGREKEWGFSPGAGEDLGEERGGGAGEGGGGGVWAHVLVPGKLLGQVRR